MIKHVSDYFARLGGAFGAGWTGFWFTPSDPAMLGLIRLLTGLVVVYLHATLTFDLVDLFGPNGLLPAAEIAPLEQNTWSYLNYFSSPGELMGAHLVGLAVMVLFAVGLWTRVTSVGALVVFLSDVNRAPMITSRTEIIAAMLLFYLCFAPCGRRLSIDWLLARRARGAVATQAGELSTMATIATRLIQVHLALLVAMMGLSKLLGESWWNGEAVWWLLARRESLGDWSSLRSNPKLVELWTHAVVYFELAFPVLVWVPLARPLVLAAGVLVWASIGVATGELTFALLMCIAALAFIPPSAFALLPGKSAPAPGTA